VSLPEAIQPDGATHVRYRGRRLIYFGGCDYYRLAHHPKLLKAHAQAAARDGLGTGASRMTIGNQPGARQTRNVAGEVFRQRNRHCCRRRLPRQYRAWPGGQRPVRRGVHRRAAKRVLLMTDGVFGATGRVAPVGDLAKRLARSATLWIDDAHGAGVLGVLGERLRGTAEQCGLGGRRVIQSITFSKAFGSFGGAILGPRWLRSALLDGNNVVTGSSSLPAGLAKAMLASLELLRTRPALAKRLRRNTTFVKAKLLAAGQPSGDSAFPVFGLDCPEKKAAMVLSHRLLATGIYPSCIRYPTGSEWAFYRFAISSEHTREQLEHLVAALSG
jgi:7-keto-8-aminopelargonate synthetase-like enzyme